MWQPIVVIRSAIRHRHGLSHPPNSVCSLIFGKPRIIRYYIFMFCWWHSAASCGKRMMLLWQATNTIHRLKSFVPFLLSAHCFLTTARGFDAVHHVISSFCPVSLLVVNKCLLVISLSPASFISRWLVAVRWVCPRAAVWPNLAWLSNGVCRVKPALVPAKPWWSFVMAPLVMNTLQNKRNGNKVNKGHKTTKPFEKPATILLI